MKVGISGLETLCPRTCFMPLLSNTFSDATSGSRDVSADLAQKQEQRHVVRAHLVHHESTNVAG